ncbi:PAB-dependent poly(A)-specific ribonuclease subunit 3, partial [Lecanoromycetidae sp. Uapishka_2]
MWASDSNADYSHSNAFDTYTAPTPAALTSNNPEIQQPANSFSVETNGYPQTFFSGASTHSQYLQHHHYAPLEAQQKFSKPNQRTVRDSFIPEDLRRKLQAKTDASLITFPNFEATTENENAIKSIRTRWAPIVNSNIVSVHYAFTTTEFNDSSLMIVSDYHPASIVVADKPSISAFSRPTRTSALQQNAEPLEAIVWNYIVQIANGLQAIHAAGLAARTIDINKVLVTDENRIRLSGCAIESLFEKQPYNIEVLQEKDFLDFEKFLVAIGAKYMGHSNSRFRAQGQTPDPFSKCSARLKSIITWLHGHDRDQNSHDVGVLLEMISKNMTDAFDASLRLDDELQSHLSKELENSRIVRLMTKLNCLNERPEHEHDRAWSTQGSRAVIALFRDYVFHQVDAQGNPVVNMGHILTCLNKLDVGVEEKIRLTTRDESNIIVVSYKEVKLEIDRAWQDLMRRSTN